MSKASELIERVVDGESPRSVVEAKDLKSFESDVKKLLAKFSKTGTDTAQVASKEVLKDISGSGGPWKSIIKRQHDAGFSAHDAARHWMYTSDEWDEDVALKTQKIIDKKYKVK